MNKIAIQKTIDLTRAMPEKFNMSEVMHSSAPHYEGARAQLNECGAAACILGFAVAANDPYSFTVDDRHAAKLLDITDLDARNLFYPNPFKGIAPIFERDAEKGIKVLKHLMKTGEVDWTVAYSEQEQ